MTDDLVKRLREVPSIGGYFKDPLSLEAAARIEKLEAVLREIVELGFWDGDRAMDIARKALEGGVE